jgi:hypothetical protein
MREFQWEVAAMLLRFWVGPMTQDRVHKLATEQCRIELDMRACWHRKVSLQASLIAGHWV